MLGPAHPRLQLYIFVVVAQVIVNVKCSDLSSLLLAGSSTACIVVLDRRSHQIHTCNLGDSGFLVVRGGEVIHRSDEQQHYFNTPFQLSIAPPGAEGSVLSDRWVEPLYSLTFCFTTISTTCLCVCVSYLIEYMIEVSSDLYASW